jgi:O-methyltransferase
VSPWVRKLAVKLVCTPFGQRLAGKTVGLMRDRPVRKLPGWFGELHEISVPRGVRGSAEPSPASSANINVILDLLDTTSAVEGHVAECGVFRGATLVPTARYLEEIGSPKRLLGFDSFRGFGEEIQYDLALGGAENEFKQKGGFDQTSFDHVWGKVLKFGLGARVTLVPGFFRDSLQSVAGERFSFVHLDCDIYASYKECLEFFYPRTNAGGVILIDEYDDPPWPGCNQAVDEFLKGKPETLAEIDRNHHLKYYIRKA